jgi:cysteine desulfurase
MLLLELDKRGICASGGSACSSGERAPSHVLLAIGLDKEWIDGTIRISLGGENTVEEIDYLIKEISEIYKSEKDDT